MPVRSLTASLSSSIYKSVEENGRTYHRYKDGRYFLPDDSEEQKRLDLQHYLFVATFGNNLYIAPFAEPPRRVLDIATGTGIWAIEFAIKHPEAQVFGTDLSPIQPEFIPENCTFEVDDAEDPWTWNQPFDYIHGRALLSCFRDPKGVIQQAFDNLSPGGYLELQDACFPFSFADGSPEDTYMHKWNNSITEALVTKTDRTWDNVRRYKRFMEEVGFEDVVERNFYWPTNQWAKGKYYKSLAALFQEDMSTGLESISLRLFSLLGWDVPKIKDFLEKVWADFKDPKIRCYLEIKCVYGRKPTPSY
ncbi:S-adenosyl-L-methionine-dependent methyltransferase [Thozetella sp. PMI_491]|nr:S-adenosyl-L-methionine-dependent methyltransferase [Thozetella sp. PMI_491]